MKKTPVFFILFLFATTIGGFFYLEQTHFFDIDACLSNGGAWNYEESACKTDKDIDDCESGNGKWIPEENTCDYGIIIR